MDTFVLPDKLVNKICCSIVNRLLSELHLFSSPINDLHELNNGVALVELIECFESLTFHEAPAKVARRDRLSIAPKSHEETNLEFVERWLKTEGIVMDSKRSIRMIFDELNKSNEELANFIASFTPNQLSEASIASIVAQQKTLIYARSIAYISALCYAIITIFLKHKTQFVHTVPGYNFQVADNELLHILFYTKWKLTEEELLIKDLEYMRLKDRLEMLEIEKKRLEDVIRFYGIKKEDTQKIIEMQAVMNAEQKSSVADKVSVRRLEVRSREPNPTNNLNNRSIKTAESNLKSTKTRKTTEIDSLSSMTISSLAETFSVGTITDLNGLDKDIVAIYRHPLRQPQTQQLKHSSQFEDLRKDTNDLSKRSSLPTNLINIPTKLSQDKNNWNTKDKQTKLEDRTIWQSKHTKEDNEIRNSNHQKQDQIDGKLEKVWQQKPNIVHEEMKKNVWQVKSDNLKEKSMTPQHPDDMNEEKDMKTIWSQRPNNVNEKEVNKTMWQPKTDNFEQIKTVLQPKSENIHKEDTHTTLLQQRPDNVKEVQTVWRSKLNEVNNEDEDLEYYDNLSYDYNTYVNSDLSSVSNGYKMKFEYNKHRIERALNGNLVEPVKSSKKPSSLMDSDTTPSHTPKVSRKTKIHKPSNPPPPLPTSKPPNEIEQYEKVQSSTPRINQLTSFRPTVYVPREEHVHDDEQQRNRILIARLLAELSYEKKKKSNSPTQSLEPVLRETNVDYI